MKRLSVNKKGAVMAVSTAATASTAPTASAAPTASTAPTVSAAPTAPVGQSAIGLATAVLIHGPISRGELGRRLGLSAASLTRLSRPFLEQGLFVELSEDHHRGVGRPTRPLDVRADARRFVGIKLTGEDIFAVLTDLRATELDSTSEPLAGREVDDVVARLEAVVRRLAAGRDIAAVGVSVGGNVAGSRIVTQAPFLGWRDVDLAGALEARLGIPVLVENDVVGLASAEQWFGLSRDTPTFALLTIGVAVGYALVRNGEVIGTADSGLGLGGHVPLAADGPLCEDGHRGCSNAMLSEASICAQVEDLLGRPVTYHEVLALAVAGDPAALAVLGSTARALGTLVALVANLAMLTSVVLAGEGIGLWSIVGDQVVEAVRAGRNPGATALSITIDETGVSSWARGAAAVAIRHTLARLTAPR